MKEMDLDRLLEISGERAEALCDELYRISYLVKQNYELMSALTDPKLAGEAKKKVIGDLMPGASKIFSEIISLMIDQELIKELDQVSVDFTLLVAKKMNIRFDEVIFSEKPGEDILNKFKKIAGDKIRYRIQIDPTLIGGFIWKTMDGKVMNASIKGRLSQIREEIAA